VTERPWSIEQRLVRWITGSSLAMAALFSVAAFKFVSSELHNELDLLGVEEIEELETNLRGRTYSRHELERILGVIAFDHADHRFTWRLWRLGDDAPWLTLGPAPRTPLPSSATAAAASSRTPVSGTRWHWVDVPITVPEDTSIRALRVGLLLDAAPRRESANRALGLVVVVIALTSVVAVVGGVLLARRVARTLREAAVRARELDTLARGGDIAPSNAPTEVIALADAFRGSLEELRQQYSRNLLLTAGMAHELRSPLQNMLGEASVALLRDRTSDEYRAILESQLDELRDLGRVVDNLITLTALREPGALARKERFQLGAEAELRLAKDGVRATKRGIHYDIERDGDLEIAGDREALLLAVRNLVDNAVRHAPDSGHVEVRLHGDPEEITVTVDDDGPGVPVAERELMFEAFRQSQADARRRGGYGLGLALARAAAEAHGGTIEVGDSPRGGARFTLSLPRA
jgi:two-component system heavy metal sensor histidine kinase CusS